MLMNAGNEDAENEALLIGVSFKKECDRWILAVQARTQFWSSGLQTRIFSWSISFERNFEKLTRFVM